VYAQLSDLDAALLRFPFATLVQTSGTILESQLITPLAAAKVGNISFIIVHT
jgi:hypothetical protein